MIDWTAVYEKMEDAKAIAFDTCHKIYVLMDNEQIIKMREYEYDPLYTKDEMSAGEMYETLKHWYAESCGLRFIEAVSTTAEGIDPNEGFETLIEQGATETDECSECGDEDCDGYCWEERCDKCGDEDIYNDGMCQFCYEDSQEDEE